MHSIVAKAQLSPNVTRLDVVAPRIAQIRQPGQFVIVHRAEDAERIPLTMADADAKAGTVALVIQSVGKRTRDLVALEPGEAIADIVGPLGQPTELIAAARALCIGGRRRHRRGASHRPGPEAPRRGRAQHHRWPLKGVGDLQG
jgi:ferredoxin--NADP+ reductase